MSDSLLLTNSTGWGQDELAFRRLLPACRDLGLLVFLDPWESRGETVDLSGEVESDGALVPVLKLMGIGQEGLIAATSGLLLRVPLWLRGLVMRAKGASWTSLWNAPLGRGFRNRLVSLLWGRDGKWLLNISDKYLGGNNNVEEDAEFMWLNTSSGWRVAERKPALKSPWDGRAK